MLQPQEHHRFPPQVTNPLSHIAGPQLLRINPFRLFDALKSAVDETGHIRGFDKIASEIRPHISSLNEKLKTETPDQCIRRYCDAIFGADTYWPRTLLGGLSKDEQQRLAQGPVEDKIACLLGLGVALAAEENGIINFQLVAPAGSETRKALENLTKVPWEDSPQNYYALGLCMPYIEQHHGGTALGVVAAKSNCSAYATSIINMIDQPSSDQRSLVDVRLQQSPWHDSGIKVEDFIPPIVYVEPRAKQIDVDKLTIISESHRPDIGPITKFYLQHGRLVHLSVYSGVLASSIVLIRNFHELSGGAIFGYSTLICGTFAGFLGAAYRVLSRHLFPSRLPAQRDPVSEATKFRHLAHKFMIKRPAPIKQGILKFMR